MTRSFNPAAAALAFGLTIGFAAAAAQEPANPCPSSAAAAGSPCQTLATAGGGFAPDPMPTGSIDAPRDARLGVLVTPDVLDQLHRDVKLIIPDNI